jgi:MFS family permease
MVFTFGGATWAWNDGGTIALFVLFGLSLLAFVITQGWSILTTPARRLFPVDFLRHRTLVLLYIATAAGSTTLFVPIYYIPLYFSFVHNDTGMEAAVRLLPFICVMIFCAMLNGALMPKFGYYVPWYFIGSIFVLIGGSLMYSLVSVSTPNSQIYGFSVMLGIGAGLSQQAAYSVAPAKVEPHRAPDAVGFINSSQIGAVVIALTITSTVFQNIGFRHVSNALQGLGFSDADIHAALAGAKSTVFTSTPPEVREKVIEGIVKAIGDGYILIIVAGAVMLLCSVFMRREKLFMETAAGA